MLYVHVSRSQNPDAANCRRAEKEVLEVLNHIRAHPDVVLSKDLPLYLDSSKTKKTAYVVSLMADLRKSKPTEILLRSATLDSLAMQHARDMGNTGKTGHTGSGGKTFSVRTRNILQSIDDIAESLQYGYDKGGDIVMDLLIDEGVSGTGHRKQIPDANYKYVGIAVFPHKSKYRINTVIIYSSREP